MIGDVNKNWEVLHLQVDLTVPWTWIMLDGCRSCDDSTPVPDNASKFKDVNC